MILNTLGHDGKQSLQEPDLPNSYNLPLLSGKGFCEYHNLVVV